jgi:hypothetical protein
LSSVVISKVSLTRLLIPRKAVVKIKRKNLWTLTYIKHANGITEKFKLIGNRYNIKTIFKPNTFLEVQL